MSACTVQPCHRPAKARGMCGTHYARWARLGTTELRPYVTAPCSVDGCDSKTYSNGLCQVHHGRMRRTGTTAASVVPTLAARIEARIVRVDDGCWLWQGRPGKNGYGRISVDNRVLYVHRVAYELHIGPIPAGLTIDHLCRVRMCINPEHLEPVTLAENTRRELAVRWAS